METKRPKLDSPVFEGNLRYAHRETSYVRRGLTEQTMNEVKGLQQKPANESLQSSPRVLVESVPAVVAPTAAAPLQQTAPLESLLQPHVQASPRHISVADAAPEKSKAATHTSPPPVRHVPSKGTVPPSVGTTHYISDILPPKPKAKIAPPAPESFQTLQDIIAPKSRVTAAHAVAPVVPEEAPISNETQPGQVIVPNAGASKPSQQIPKRRKFKPTKQGVLYTMAGIVFVAGLAVSLNGLRANHQVATQVKQAQKTAQDSAGQDSSAGASTAVPSSAPISSKTVSSYTVSPTIPRYLNIPKLKVHARILSEGLDRKGALQVPWNIYDTGWYNASTQPGQPGAMLIDGHSGIGKQYGVFHGLGTLTNGDVISVTRGDGTSYNYTVVSVQIVDVNSVDMTSLLIPADPAKPGLSLITCTGDQIPGTDELNQRVLIRAVQQ